MKLAASIMLMDRSSCRRLSGVFAIGAVLCLGLAGVFPAHAHFPAQAQELDWATSARGTVAILGEGIATDPRGNSYVTGFFWGAATFGAGEANETVLTSAGGFDVFVAKYMRDGTLLWARSDGGDGQEEGLGIATDPRGNSYVTGSFMGTATFGAGEANESELTAAGERDVFVAKYARDGALLWARSAGGDRNDVGGAASRRTPAATAT